MDDSFLYEVQVVQMACNAIRVNRRTSNLLEIYQLSAKRILGQVYFGLHQQYPGFFRQILEEPLYKG